MNKKRISQMSAAATVDAAIKRLATERNLTYVQAHEYFMQTKRGQALWAAYIAKTREVNNG